MICKETVMEEDNLGRYQKKNVLLFHLASFLYPQAKDKGYHKKFIIN